MVGELKEAVVGTLYISGQYLRKKGKEIPEGNKALFGRERADTKEI